MKKDTRTKMPDGSAIIYTLWNGRMMKIAEPNRPDRSNFVIICEYGDWSGFRTLDECKRQFPELESQNRPNMFYKVVER